MPAPGKHLLMITHRIPFPPDKGDKIRSYNQLVFLRQNGWRIHLCTFIDDPADLRYIDRLKPLCESASFHPIGPVRRAVGMVSALVRGQALSVGAFYQPRALAYVNRVFADHPVKAIFCFSSPTAAYLFKAGKIAPNCRKVMDLIDVDSDKWRQYALQCRPPQSWLYRREAVRLAAYEKRIAETFDATLLVSAQEVVFFRRQVVDSARVHALPNGVDTAFFHPRTSGKDPFDEDTCALVFCGMMDYAPNVDAVVWFTNEVMPRLREKLGAVRFDIVGARPTREVQALGKMADVKVHGRVADVRPYVWNAAISVAPVRIARGIQNKVLEAMAMGRPVVASEQAFEGIEATAGRDLAVERAEPAAFCDAIVNLWKNRSLAADMGRQARGLVVQRYGWNARLTPLQTLLS
jgi:sugar transferase (PEP-CTERM/EpsH1 system associated)